MNAWVGLLKKEFRTTRTFVFVTLGALAVFMVATYLFSLRVGHPIALFGLAFIPIGLHIGYMVVYMLLSLNAESKRLHLWLHTPQPATQLLAAKLVNGLTGFLLTMIPSFLFLLYGTSRFNQWAEIYQHMSINAGVLFRGALIIAISILFGAILLSLWVVATWTIYQVCKTRIGRWGILAAFGFLLLSTYIMGIFEGTTLYHFLTDWGHFSLLELVNFEALNLPGDYGVIEDQIPFGAVVYQVVIGILLFALSSVLLDRKVEV